MKNLSRLNSVTKLLKSKDSVSSEDLEKKHPEFLSAKPTSYYLFRKKTKTYVKNSEEKSFDTNMRFDKSYIVSDIVQKLVDSGDSYLRHGKHIDNIATVLTTGVGYS